METYWTDDLNDVIEQYNSSTDDLERELLFKHHIEQPIRKLAECIVNMHSSMFTQNKEELMHDVVSHVVTNLHNYDISKGKSFSYFSIASKNYVWNHNNKLISNHKKTRTFNRWEDYTNFRTLYEEESDDSLIGLPHHRLLHDNMIVHPKLTEDETNNYYSNKLEKIVTHMKTCKYCTRLNSQKNICRAFEKIMIDFKNRKHEAPDSSKSTGKHWSYELIRRYSGEKTITIRRYLLKVRNHMNEQSN